LLFWWKIKKAINRPKNRFAAKTAEKTKEKVSFCKVNLGVLIWVLPVFEKKHFFCAPVHSPNLWIVPTPHL
jgi:hypothetical protein